MSVKRTHVLRGCALAFVHTPDVCTVGVDNVVWRTLLTSEGNHASVEVHGNRIMEIFRLLTEDQQLVVKVRHCGYPTMLTCKVINEVLPSLGVDEKVVLRGGNLTIDGDQEVQLCDEQWVTLVSYVH